MTVVQQEWDFGLGLDSYLTEGYDIFESLNLPPLEELWKTELENLSDAWNLQDDFSNMDCKRGSSMIRVHDCMWAGSCLSKDHVGRKDKCQQSCTQVSATSSGSTISSSSPVKVPQNKSLLLPSITVQQTPQRSIIIRKPSVPAPQKVLHRPDTPQSEDDLSKPDDHDQSWLRGVAVSEITGQRRTETTLIQTPTTIANNVSFDHNYNTKQKPRTDDLGVVTPSDSAEEESEETEDDCGASEVDNEGELEEEEDEEEDEDEEEEIDVVSLKPPSPPRKQLMRMQEQWRRQEKLRMQEWNREEKLRRMHMSQQEQAVKFASQAISKRLSAVSDLHTTRINNRRQKRKRTMMSDDEDSKTDLYVPNYRMKQNQRKNTSRRKIHSTPSKKTRISTDSETDCTEKRSQHNNMERKRRIDLRNAFEDLRSLVPSLAESQRAAKVTILKDAANYCSQLNSNARTLQSQVAILRREQEKLRQNLSKLRKHIAHKHVGSNHR